MSVELELGIVAAVIALISLSVVGIVYLRFGNGLTFRIFALCGPVMGLIGIMGTVLGKLGLTVVTGAAVIGPGSVIAIVSLVQLNRIVVKNLRRHVEQLSASTTQLAATAQQSAATAAQQFSMVAEVSTTIEEIHQTSTAASESAQAVVEAASQAVEQSRPGQSAVAEAVRIMDLIGQVGVVVDTVNELAEQSNLLAVNASIEASKAGEHGRGFAVVAAEVRSLAGQSKTATKQIGVAIGSTDDGRDAIEVLRQLIDQQATVLDDASEKARTIAGASLQQATGIRQINEAMGSLEQGGQDTAGAAEQIEQAVRGQEDLSGDLRRFVDGSAKERAPSSLSRAAAA